MNTQPLRLGLSGIGHIGEGNEKLGALLGLETWRAC